MQISGIEAGKAWLKKFSSFDFIRRWGAMLDLFGVNAHRETQSQLRQSEELYRKLILASPDAISVIDPNGSIKFGSPRAVDLLGVQSEADLTGKSLFEYISAESLQALQLSFQQLKNGEDLISGQLSFMRKDGSHFIAETSSTAVRDDSGGVHSLIISMRDITKRKKNELVQDALYRISQTVYSTENLNELYRAIHAILGELMQTRNFYIAIYDPLTDLLTFPYFVDTYDPAPAPRKRGMTLTDYVLRKGESILAYPVRFEDLRASGEVFSQGTASVDWMGVPLKTKDQTFGVMAVQSYTEGVRFSQEDLDIMTFVSNQVATVIARKQAEEALRFSEQLYHTTLDSLTEWIHVVDTNLKLIFANESLAETYSGLLNNGEVIGRPIQECFPFLTEKHLAEYQEVIKSRRPKKTSEITFIHNHKFITDTIKVPILENDEVTRVVTVVRDITSQKMAEEQIRAALGEKELLLQEIHHRVKNNLQVMSSLLGLQMDYIEDPHALEMIQSTQSRIRSMALIHEELYQSQDLAHINMSEYIQKLVISLLHAFGANPGIKVTTQVEDIFLGVNTAIPCGLIINELISNALKYAFPNGEAGEIQIGLQSESATGSRASYTLIVSDNGVGFPIHIDFKNTTSLGMQLVNILTNQLKGKIQLLRQNGTQFIITF